MPNINNPAGRLYKLLADIQKVKTSTPLRNTLAKFAKCEPKEVARIYYFLSESANLADETIELIKKLEGINPENYIDPLTKISKGLISTSLDIHTTTFSNRVLNSTNMLSLRACADMLTTIYPVEEEIQEADLAVLKEEIYALMNEIVTMKMPEELKIFLLNNLEKIRKAIMGYSIYGNQGLKTALESAMGATFLAKDLIQDKENEKGKKIVEKFFVIINKTAEVLSLAEKVKSLAGSSIITLLSPPTN